MIRLAALVAVPASVAFVAPLGAATLSRSLHPRRATRMLTALILIAALSVFWTLGVVVLANVVQLHGIAERLAWCRGAVPAHLDRVTPLAISCFALLAASSVAAFRCMRLHTSIRAKDGEPVFAIVASEMPAAFALPGRPGQVIVSSSMLDALDTRERVALIAHEQAHLDLRHYLYLRASDVAAAAVPPLRPLARRIRLALEQWADEEAAQVVGDRRVVGRAIARAALVAVPSPSVALGATDAGVIVRVNALMDRPKRPSRLVTLASTLVVGLSFVGLMLGIIEAEQWFAHVLGICSI